MADASKTIDLIFNGVDKTSAATKAVLSNIDSLTGSVKTITQPVADFTVGAAKLEAGIMATGAAMTAFSVKTAGDFDTAFKSISTLFTASDADVAAYRESVKTYAAGSSKSMQDVMDSISAAIGAGVNYKDSLSVVGTAEKLSISTRSDLKSTTETLVSTLNAYGMSTTKAGQVSDVLFQTIKDGKLTMSDLSQSLSMVTPIAATAGVPLEQIGAAIATLTASGMQPGQSIEYLRSMLSNIIKPSDSAATAAKEMGLAFDAQTLKTKGLTGMLDSMRTATGGSVDKMSRLIGDVGGLSAAMVLTGAGTESFKTSMDNMAGSAGSTSEAYGKMADSMEVSTGKIKASFTGMAVEVGEPLLDAFGGVSQSITEIFNALAESFKDGALSKVMDYITGLASQIETTFSSIATNLPAALGKADLSGFTKGIDSVVSAFGALFKGVDLTTVEGLTKAIELAGAAFLGLSKYVSGAIESFAPLLQLLVSASTEAGKVDSSFLSAAGQVGGFVTQANLLVTGLAGLLPALTALVDILVVKQGLSLVGGLAAAASGTASLAAVFSGPAGVGVAAGAAAAGIGAVVYALTQYGQAQYKLTQSQQQGKDVATRALPTLEEFTKTTGIAVQSVDEAISLVENGDVVWSSKLNGWVKFGDTLADVADAANSVKNPFDGSDNPFDAANQAMLDAYAASQKTGKAQETLGKYMIKTVPIIDAATGAITGYTQELVKSKDGAIDLSTQSGKAGSALSQTAADIKKAEDAQRAWNQEVQRMQFQEKLELIKSTTSITVAQIEADARKVTAAFESINTTITSTGQLLSELYKQLGNYNLTGADQFRIRDQIDLENKRRQDALDLQKKLTLSIIAEMEARTKALDAGQALITINGDGLAPHLEAFMWEVLKAVQTRVNRDGLSMLLGM